MRYAPIIDGLQFSAEIAPLPGNSDVAVSYGMYSMTKPGQGGAHVALEDRLDMLRDAGYSAMLCTVMEDNIAQIKTIEKEGVLLGSFRSYRTKNRVRLYLVQL